MARDRNAGRGLRRTIQLSPERFQSLISTHGIYSRIMQGRVCPNKGTSGHSVHCALCFGDEHIYTYQRRMLQTDEMSVVRNERNIVYPYRVPLLEPLKVEVLRPPEQGGIQRYKIDSFDEEKINISGEPFPWHYEQMRVSYYFDRFIKAIGDTLKVDQKSRVCETTATLVNDKYVTSNPTNASGDVVEVLRVYDDGGDYIVEKFKKNQIYLRESGNRPWWQSTSLKADYYYAPAEQVLVGDLDPNIDYEQRMPAMPQSAVRIGLDSWWDVHQGDMITLLVTEFVREEIVGHGTGVDRLAEFDVSRIVTDIIDATGKTYYLNTDFYLRPFNEVVWFGRQPAPNTKYSVRYMYHPSYIIFMQEPSPNNADNKQFPKTFMGKLYTKTLVKDIERLKSNPSLTPEQVMSSVMGGLPSGAI